MKAGRSTTSLENHTLLVQLTDAVGGLGKQMATHISEQQEVNNRLHQRIDGVQNETRQGVDSIKASLSGMGKVNSTQVFALVAVLVSVLTMFGGLAHSYLSVRLGNITPLIDSNAAGLEMAMEELRRTRADVTQERLESAREHARATEARRWMEKLLLDGAGPETRTTTTTENTP